LLLLARDPAVLAAIRIIVTSLTTSQTARRSQVSSDRPHIRKIEVAAPRGATSQIAGARNGRSRAGLVKRSTSVPTETIAKASCVPIETSSPKRPIENSPASTAVAMPETMVET